MKSNLKLIGGKPLRSPKGLKTRPTTARTREAVINILRGNLTNCHWLDICSGSGIMGCEALQMGARRVFSIESNNETAQICKANLIATASELKHKFSLEVITSEAENVLKKNCHKNSIKFAKEFPNCDYRFDFAYIDPPYQSGLYGKILENLTLGNWIKEDGFAICEYSRKFPPLLPSGWKEINQKIYGNSGLIFVTPTQA